MYFQWENFHPIKIIWWLFIEIFSYMFRYLIMMNNFLIKFRKFTLFVKYFSILILECNFHFIHRAIYIEQIFIHLKILSLKLGFHLYTYWFQMNYEYYLNENQNLICLFLLIKKDHQIYYGKLKNNIILEFIFYY